MGSVVMVGIPMRLFILAFSLAVITEAAEEQPPRDGRAFPSPENRITMDNFAPLEDVGFLSSFFRTDNRQRSNIRSGINMMPNPINTDYSAIKEFNPFERQSPSYRSGRPCHPRGKSSYWRNDGNEDCCNGRGNRDCGIGEGDCDKD